MHYPLGSIHTWQRCHLVPLRTWSAVGSWSAGRRGLLLHAAQFRDILDDEGNTSSAYKGAARSLAQLSTRTRGSVLQNLAMGVLLDRNPGSIIAHPEPGLRIDGTQRSHAQAEYDWVFNGRRVECKSAQLCWTSANRTWGFQFRNIKLPWQDARADAAFDDLVLVLFMPDKLHFVQHDLVLGLASAGVSTQVGGHCVKLRGKAGQCWEAACNSILKRLFSEPSNCIHLQELDVEDTRVTRAISESLDQNGLMLSTAMYQGVPLFTTSASLRGLRFQSIALQIDQEMHPTSEFSFGTEEHAVNGTRRGVARAKCDWIRRGTRVEFKHAKLVWVDRAQLWICRWQDIKFGSGGHSGSGHFDELWLAIYSPFGLHIFLHNGKFGRTGTGKNSQLLGDSVVVYGLKGERGIPASLETMMSKLQAAGCQLLATVKW
eukprot:gb/GFBE01046498.1/.p1 GENE.gb/GFBE01046498.1/~~gb/GFBE01046498.1/.p1  ORF type:complete len:431 (+),score=37.90 gb/GFBE01046498.1/:1-1293(+)